MIVDDKILKDLISRLNRVEREAVRLRVGDAEGADSVTFGGSDEPLTGLRTLNTIADGDRILALSRGGGDNPVVLGPVGGADLGQLLQRVSAYAAYSQMYVDFHSFTVYGGPGYVEATWTPPEIGTIISGVLAMGVSTGGVGDAWSSGGGVSGGELFCWAKAPTAQTIPCNGIAIGY